jgi:hypothetical protein
MGSFISLFADVLAFLKDAKALWKVFKTFGFLATVALALAVVVYQCIKVPDKPGMKEDPSELETFYDTEVTDDHLKIIANNLGDKWKEIGLQLGWKYGELEDFEQSERHLNLRLLAVLDKWKRSGERKVGELVAACVRANVGGDAKRLLKYKDKNNK